MELTNQQKNIVNYDKLGTLIVKGTAGSGKSLVGIHRINYLFSKNKSSLFADKKSCRVLVITFNKVMFYQLKQSFESIKNDDISYHDVEFINIDKIIYKETASTLETEKYEMIFYNSIEIKTIIKKLNYMKNKYSDDFIFDEFSWIRNNLILKKEDYLNIIRLGRGKRKLNINDREYIWDLLKKYRRELLSERKIDYLDACILTLKKNKINKFDDFNHIIVDEAQDLSRLKLEFILKINNQNLSKIQNSLMFLYDSSQNVYDESWLGYGRSFASIGLDVRGKVMKLETSYRTTRQIHQAAHNLLSYYKDNNIDKETDIKPLFAGTENGIKPFIFDFTDNTQENEVFIKIIKDITKKSYEYKDIMIVSFTKNALVNIKKELTKAEIPSYILDGDLIEKGSINLDDNRIKILTIHNAKGLESKVVFIANTNSLSYMAKKSEENEKDITESHIRNSKILYTAMTRAKELLFISKDDEYIDKINEKYLTKITNSKDIDINSYLSANLETNNILIKNNSTKRFAPLIEEYKKQIKEQEEKRIENEQRIQQELYSNYDEVSGIEYFEKEFNGLDNSIIKLIAEAEVLYDLYQKNSITSSIVYVAYSKILEQMLRNFLEKVQQEFAKKSTFGTIIIHIKKFKNLEKICKEIEELQIIKNRNDATHYILKDNNQVNIIRNFLIKDKKISELQDSINKQIKIELKLPEQIDLSGYVLGTGAKVKVNRKEYYSYLINDDDLSICKDKIKIGNYKLKGHYTNSRGLKLYVIDNYQKID